MHLADAFIQSNMHEFLFQVHALHTHTHTHSIYKMHAHTQINKHFSDGKLTRDTINHEALSDRHPREYVRCKNVTSSMSSVTHTTHTH